MEISKLKDVIYELANVAEYEFAPQYFKNIDNACVEICDRLDELQAFKDKQEQGLLIELPCKVGDTVYTFYFGEVIETKVVEIRQTLRGLFFILYISSVLVKSMMKSEDFGKIVFLTRSEAEEALAKMGGK